MQIVFHGDSFPIHDADGMSCRYDFMQRVPHADDLSCGPSLIHNADSMLCRYSSCTEGLMQLVFPSDQSLVHDCCVGAS